MDIYKTYKDEVKNITGRYFKKYGYKISSYEDLEQTVWYILLSGVKKFDGRGDLKKFLLSFIKNKLISILKYNRKPPYCQDSPFTPLTSEYISIDDSKSKYFREIHGEYDWKGRKNAAFFIFKIKPLNTFLFLLYAIILSDFKNF